MAPNKLVELSTVFAVEILNLTDTINGHRSLSNQLERSGTSIGANIREAQCAHGKADFVAKHHRPTKPRFCRTHIKEISLFVYLARELLKKVEEYGIIKKIIA